MSNNGPYKVRRTKQKNGYVACAISIPNKLADILPEEVLFNVELTDEGILYRPVSTPALTLEAPSWVTGEGEKPKSVKPVAA